MSTPSSSNEPSDTNGANTNAQRAGNYNKAFDEQELDNIHPQLIMQSATLGTGNQQQQSESDDSASIQEDDLLVNESDMEGSDNQNDSALFVNEESASPPSENNRGDRGVNQANNTRIGDNSLHTQQAQTRVNEGRPGEQVRILQFQNSSSDENVSDSSIDDDSTDDEVMNGEPPLKRKKLDEDLRVVHPSNYTMITQTKAISEGRIDRFWEPLEDMNVKSLTNILNLSLNKALDSLGGANTGDSGLNRNITTQKIMQAKEILSKTWLDMNNPQSFLARSVVSKFPLPGSVLTEGIVTRHVGELRDVLNYETLISRQTALEAYLSAEIEQVQQLESVYNELETQYLADKRYLIQLLGTVKTDIKELESDIKNKRRQLSLHNLKPNPDKGINLLTTTKRLSDFDPDKDEDIKPLLENIERNLKKISTPETRSLIELNEKLETLHHLFN
ncbi:uncharacterized protein J8A68_003598 [[Candida] subhashii]|uniref:Uncharacterized protein n=1 Tax=[Candida] subhashii TaxID=561895 RepID=A0A8J5UY94_9ASCO|nr:uncharacterized protein J8A68_003598 [[Candida] subhashii]KAG7662914.1 hypothetical protein J8A68_003598 [[Candida] subhashii]